LVTPVSLLKRINLQYNHLKYEFSTIGINKTSS
jgi:hypothetical protein